MYGHGGHGSRLGPVVFRPEVVGLEVIGHDIVGP